MGSKPPQRLRVASKAFIVRDDMMLVLYKPRHDYERSLNPDARIDTPGGCIEFGESFEEGLHREVMEETGLTVRIIAPFNTWSFSRQDPDTHRQVLGVDFVCEWTSGEVTLSEEHEAFEWLALEEIQARGWPIGTDFAKAFEIYQQLS